MAMETVISEVAQTIGIELKLEQEKLLEDLYKEMMFLFHYQQVLVNLLYMGYYLELLIGLGIKVTQLF